MENKNNLNQPYCIAVDASSVIKNNASKGLYSKYLPDNDKNQDIPQVAGTYTS